MLIDEVGGPRVRMSWWELRTQLAAGRVKRGLFRATRGLWWLSDPGTWWNDRTQRERWCRLVIRPDFTGDAGRACPWCSLEWCYVPGHPELGGPACDCWHRIQCNTVGDVGHQACGWCWSHQRPRFQCGCRLVKPGVGLGEPGRLVGTVMFVSVYEDYAEDDNDGDDDRFGPGRRRAGGSQGCSGACAMTTPAVTPPGRLSREQREQIRARFEQLGGMVDDDAAALLADLDARDALLAEAPELIERLRHYMGIQDGTIEMRHVPCPRCNGRGYHHGFGEHGHDPDWCEQCGGPGELLHPDDNGDPTELVTQAADLLSRLLPDEEPFNLQHGDALEYDLTIRADGSTTVENVRKVPAVDDHALTDLGDCVSWCLACRRDRERAELYEPFGAPKAWGRTRAWFRRQRGEAFGLELERTNAGCHIGKVYQAVPAILDRDLPLILKLLSWWRLDTWPKWLGDLLFPKAWLEELAVDYFLGTQPEVVHPLKSLSLPGVAYAVGSSSPAIGMIDQLNRDIASLSGVPIPVVLNPNLRPDVIEIRQGDRLLGTFTLPPGEVRLTRFAGQPLKDDALGENRWRRREAPRVTVAKCARCDEPVADVDRGCPCWVPSSSERCRSVDAGDRCVLGLEHQGLHQDSFKHRPRYWSRR